MVVENVDLYGATAFSVVYGVRRRCGAMKVQSQPVIWRVTSNLTQNRTHNRRARDSRPPTRQALPTSSFFYFKASLTLIILSLSSRRLCCFKHHRRTLLLRAAFLTAHRQWWQTDGCQTDSRNQSVRPSMRWKRKKAHNIISVGLHRHPTRSFIHILYYR